MTLTTHEFSDYSYTEGSCIYRAKYPGRVSTNKHYNPSDVAQIELRFKPQSTVEQIDYAARREKERLQKEKERYMANGMSEEEARNEVVKKHGEIDWGFSLLFACNNLVESNCMKQVDYVLSKGADPNWEPDGECYGFLDFKPLLVACAQGHLPLVKRLLEAGATPRMEHVRAAIRCRPCETGRQRTVGQVLYDFECLETQSCEAIQVLEMILSRVPPGSPDDSGDLTLLEHCEEMENDQAKEILESRGYE